MGGVITASSGAATAAQPALLAPLPTAISDHYLIEERQLVTRLERLCRLSVSDRNAITDITLDLIRSGRSQSGKTELFDSFLQEYGLSSEEGVTLMRLAEAFIRTPDRVTKHMLMRDKLAGKNWRAHKGKNASSLVNLATLGLSLSARWVEATGGPQASGLLSKIGDRVLSQGIMIAMGMMSRHFVLGRNIDDAIKHSAPLARAGFSFSYDMLGEAAHTFDDAERYRKTYQHAVDRLAQDQDGQLSDVNASPGISVKLSALHPRYEYAQRETCLPAIITAVKTMALTAKKADLGLTIDAEEAERLEVSLLVARALMSDEDLKGWDRLSIVVQAYQRRAVPVIEHLIAMAKSTDRKIAIRLVKGAYWDSEIKRAQEMGLESYPVFTRKENTDISYLACARLLLDHADYIYPQFATHNAASMAAIMYMAGPDQAYEFQRLHGMGEPLHKVAMQRSQRQSRIYAPVGAHKDLLPYLVRRLLENGANSSFVNQFLDPDIRPEDLAIDPMDKRAGNASDHDPRIPAPQNIVKPRKNAKGIDTTQSQCAAHLERAAGDFVPIIAKSIINGQEISGRSAAVTNPANSDDILGQAHALAPKHLDAAFKAAKASNWAKMMPAARAKILEEAADQLEAQSLSFMQICVKEAGKSWVDADAELREAVDFCRYYAVQVKEDNFKSRRPLGLVAAISPWNFPLAIFLGQITAALSAGNTVICKPAEQTPLIAYKAVKLLHSCGVPPDALHLTLGDGASIGAALSAHDGVDGICFTGSTATAKRISLSLSETNRPALPFIAETGGINAMIVDSTALIEQAVSDVIASAFQSAGQRCSACRIICVQDDIAPEFTRMLSGAMEALTLGDPAKLSTDIGPVIDAQAHTLLSDYIDRQSAIWPIIGKTSVDAGLPNGHFITPIAFEIPGLDSVNDEKFGPVLHVLRYKAKDFNRLIDQINGLGYGLTLGLHTRIDDKVERVSRAAHIGNIYVNRNQIGAVVGVQPFGGEGLSGTGPKAGGPLYLKRLSRPAQTKTGGHSTNAKSPHERFEILDTLLEKLELSDAATRAACHDIIHQARALPWTQSLPGPTGEDNQLCLHPRGALVLCASHDDKQLWPLIFKALACGNRLILNVKPDSSQALSGLITQLKVMGTSDDLTTYALDLSPNNLDNLDFEGLLVDAASKDVWAHALCRRAGAILPVLTVSDDIERFVIERTRTIDTTAAGGNATLLAM